MIILDPGKEYDCILALVLSLDCLPTNPKGWIKQSFQTKLATIDIHDITLCEEA